MSLLSDTEWSGEEEGNLSCPGAAFHERNHGGSFPSSRKDHHCQKLSSWLWDRGEEDFQSASRPLPCPHVSSLSTHRWSSCVDRPIPVWNMWTLNVSSPPSVCVCFYGCLRLFCWNAGSFLQLTSSGWLLLSYSDLTTENESVTLPLGLSRVYLWCEWTTIQIEAERQSAINTNRK